MMALLLLWGQAAASSPSSSRAADIVGCYEVAVSGRAADVIRRRLPARMELRADGVSGRSPDKVPEQGDRQLRGISGGREVRVDDMRWRLVRDGGCEIVWGFGTDDEVKLKLVRERDALLGTARASGGGPSGGPTVKVEMKRISCEQLPRRE